VPGPGNCQDPARGYSSCPERQGKISLATVADTFIAGSQAASFPFEVLHRIASKSSGGMVTLPHKGAVITLLAVTGLTYKDSNKEIFMITLLKFAAAFVAIGVYTVTGIY
jgi:H+/gluconate symporter-like permease